MANICTVCLEIPKYPITLKCRHKFCYLCVKFVKENTKCCPLCREPITETLDKLSIAEIGFSSPMQQEFPCSKWLFNSRDEKSWWYYDDEVNTQIEHHYQNWKENRAPQLNDSSDSSSDSDSNSEDSKLDDVPKINVGPHEYVIDFENMYQVGHRKSRKIIRKEFFNWTEKNNFDKTIRGIVGIYFEKK